MFRQMYKYIDENMYDPNLHKMLIKKFMQIIKQILNNEFKIQDFVISKTLAREYKNPDA